MANLLMPDLDKVVHVGDFSQMAVTGIYFLIHEGVVVYVGQARNIRSRVGQHLSEGAKEFNSVAYVRCKLSSLDCLERGYIERLLPKYNQCSQSKALRQLGIESPTGGRLVAVEKRIRIPRAKAHRTISVLA